MNTFLEYVITPGFDISLVLDAAISNMSVGHSAIN